VGDECGERNFGGEGGWAVKVEREAVIVSVVTVVRE
jgi:hypothetical protein